MPHLIECPQCSGEGYTWADDTKHGEHVTTETRCDRCDGDGKVECSDDECEECAHEKQEAAIRAELTTLHMRRTARYAKHALADFDVGAMTPRQAEAMVDAMAALMALEVA